MKYVMGTMLAAFSGAMSFAAPDVTPYLLVIVGPIGGAMYADNRPTS